MSFYPFLKKFIDKLSAKEPLSMELVPVENMFFGSSVTVTGLLTGRDVMKSLIDKVEGNTVILIPDVVLNYENRFLDDISLYDLQENLGASVLKIKSTPAGLIKGITET
jgi:NifB/MoaA-like Fe-S oxidoreductase